MLSYFNGKYLPKEEICISPDDRGFLFADGLYEVVRSYSGELFRLKDEEGLELEFDQIDQILDRCIDIARRRMQ